MNYAEEILQQEQDSNFSTPTVEQSGEEWIDAFFLEYQQVYLNR